MVVANSFSFQTIEDTASMIYSIGLRGNGASALLIAGGEMISASFRLPDRERDTAST